MRHYETVFILNPDLPEEEQTQITDRYAKILTDAGAEPLLTDVWGRRRLAYEINNFSKGYYVLLEYLAPTPAIAELERNMRLDDNCLRYLTVKKADTFDRAEFEARQAKATQAATGREEASDEEPETKAKEAPDEEPETKAKEASPKEEPEPAESPVEEASTEEAATEEAPVEEPPAEEASTEEASAEETPEKEKAEEA